MSKSHEYCLKKLSELKDYENNARTHPPKQIKKVKASIKRFGFTNPVLIDEDDTIIAGHCRTLCAKQLKMSEVPCIKLVGLTDAEKKAYVLADNQLPLDAGWDMAMLENELLDLQSADFDLDLTGFDSDILGSLGSLDSLDISPTKTITAKDMENNDERILNNEKQYVEKFSVVVECKNEAEQEKLFNKLTKEGFSCRVQSL